MNRFRMYENLVLKQSAVTFFDLSRVIYGSCFFVCFNYDIISVIEDFHSDW